MVNQVPDNDGRDPDAKTADLVFPATIVPEKVRYRLLANQRDVGWIDLTDAVGSEWYYEDLPDEVSQRLVAKIDNSKPYGTTNLYPSDLLKMPTPLEVHADWGTGWTPVFKGTMSTEVPADTTFELVANDPLWVMLRSEDTLVMAPDTAAGEGLDYLAIRYGMPVVAGTEKPTALLDQFISRGDKVAAIYGALFAAVYGATGQEWIARYNPRAEALSNLAPGVFVGGVEYVKRGVGKQIWALTEDGAVFDRPYKRRTIDDLVTIIRIIDTPLRDQWEDGPDAQEPVLGLTKFGNFQRIVYLERHMHDLDQAKAEAMAILNEFGQPKEEMRFESFDLPWLRRWDQVYVQYSPLGSIYHVEGVVHDCLTGKMSVNLEGRRALLFPSAFEIPDAEVTQRNEYDPDSETPSTAPTGSLRWPLPGVPNTAGGNLFTPPGHNGIDIHGASHCTVYAPGDGKVDPAVTGHSHLDGSGYGNYVRIDHGKDAAGRSISTICAHLNTVNVTDGQNISAGQIIGQQGETGKAYGEHVHFEVRADGTPIDPGSVCGIWSL